MRKNHIQKHYLAALLKVAGKNIYPLFLHIVVFCLAITSYTVNGQTVNRGTVCPQGEYNSGGCVGFNSGVSGTRMFGRGTVFSFRKQGIQAYVDYVTWTQLESEYGDERSDTDPLRVNIATELLKYDSNHKGTAYFDYIAPTVTSVTTLYFKLVLKIDRRSSAKDKFINIGVEKHTIYPTPPTTFSRANKTFDMLENERYVGKITSTYVATGESSIHYSIAKFDDQGLFRVDAATGHIYFKNNFIPDFEKPRDYRGIIDVNTDQNYWVTIDTHLIIPKYGDSRYRSSNLGKERRDALRITIRDVTQEDPIADGNTDDFVTIWEIAEDKKSILFPGIGSYTIDWGDGTKGDGPTIGSDGTTVGDGHIGNRRHTYAEAGTYKVRVSNGIIGLDTGKVGLRGEQPENFSQMTYVEQWGTAHWEFLENAFKYMTELDIVAIDRPDFSRVEDFRHMFDNASSFTGYNTDINDWDVSNATNMSRMFRNATSFNGTIGRWDVSSVAYMNDMFFGSARFNQNIINWDVSNVTEMQGIFRDATSFNRDISKWNVGNVTSLYFAFNGASNFNKNLGDWNVSKVRNFSDTFEGANISTINYDKLLIGWSGRDLVDGITLNISAPACSTEAITARETIKTSDMWTINDGGQRCGLVVSPTGSIIDGNVYESLGGASDVAAVKIGQETYAVVTGKSDNAVQIINISDPDRPTPVSTIQRAGGGNILRNLRGPSAVATVVIGANTYAVVTSYIGGSVQIIKITDPTTPVTVSQISDGDVGYETLRGASDVAIIKIGIKTYVLVTSFLDDGVQIIDISDPATPTSVEGMGITDGGSDSVGGIYDELDGANSITIVERGIETNRLIYAIIASKNDDGVQIINITNPSVPLAITGISNGDTVNSTTYDKLKGASGVTTLIVGGKLYLLVASRFANAVQVINITDLSAPSPSGVAVDNGDGGTSSKFQELGGANGITSTMVDGSSYALIASSDDDGVQIIYLTADGEPAEVFGVSDGVDGFRTLEGASRITTVNIDNEMYALVTSESDNGIQIMKFGVDRESIDGESTQTISLRSGWNYLGFSVIPSSLSILEIFNDEIDSLEQIKTLDDAYISNRPEFLNDLTRLDNFAQGYLIKVSEAIEFTLPGRVVLLSEVEYEMKEGWNLIAYPGLVGSNIGTALRSIFEYVTDVKDDKLAYIKQRQNFLNTLTELVPGQGYFVKVSQDCTLRY